ncbi:hypothetical protein F5884DRAFT_751133 [Xylogone sp. PMI_703]|nr:hypothetical protein F5884DRAFT_751133 [Xylogone sp. PMI_703]
MAPAWVTVPSVPSHGLHSSNRARSVPALGRNGSMRARQHGRAGAAPLSQILNPTPDLGLEDLQSHCASAEPWMLSPGLAGSSQEKSSSQSAVDELSRTTSSSTEVHDAAKVPYWNHPSKHSEDAYQIATILASMSQSSGSGSPEVGPTPSSDTQPTNEDAREQSQEAHLLQLTKSVSSPDLRENPTLSAPKRRTKLPDGKTDSSKADDQSSPATEVRHKAAHSSRVPKIYKTLSPNLDARTHVIIGYFPQVATPPNKVGPPPSPMIDAEGRLMSRDAKKSSTSNSSSSKSNSNEYQRSPSWNYLVYGMLARSPAQAMTLSELFSAIITWCPNKAHRINPGDDSSLRHALTTCDKFVNVPMPKLDALGRKSDRGQGLWRIRWENEVVKNKSKVGSDQK